MERRASHGDLSSKHKASEATSRWREVYILIPVTLALLVYGNTLGNDFAFDDTQTVLNNEFIHTLGNLPSAFSTNVWAFLGDDILAAQDAYFRPLFTTLFTINYSIFGTAAWAWHLVNVLVHGAVTFFVFLICREITNRNWIALTAASLFAVHPVHSESVAWVSGVTDPLMALFALPSFYLYLLYRKTGRRHVLAAALGLFFLALLCKETAIVVPALIGYCELLLFNNSLALRHRLSRVAILSGFFAAPTFVYLLMRYYAIGDIVGRGAPRYSMGLALKTTPSVIAKYLRLMFVPDGYSIQHLTPPVTSISSEEFIGPAILLVVTVAAILLARSQTLTLASVWFMVWLAPPIASIRVFQPLYFVQDRYLYLPSLGVCLAAALGLGWLAARGFLGRSARVTGVALAVVIVIFLGVVTIDQNTAWHDTTTLFRHSVEVDPRSPFARTQLAGEYYARGKMREADAEAHAALDLDPSCIDAYLVLSVFAHASGKIEQAISYLERAEPMVQEGPQKRGYLAKIYSKLGFLHNQSKHYDVAEEYLLRRLTLTPGFAGWLELGDFYFDRARYEEARAMFEQVVAHVNPKFAPIHVKLARCYDRLEMWERARAEYEKYLELAPAGARDLIEVRQRLSQF